ncbi:TPA: protein-tyrosine phosphatase family protein [Providencia rettgeri]
MQPISVSNFTHVSGNQDARLVVKNEHNETTVTTAREGFGGRILSFLGQFPLFQRIDAVKNHLENIKTENKAAVAAFAEALSNTYGANTAHKIISHHNLETGNISLTERKIQSILIPSAQILHSKETFVEELAAKYGSNVAQQALTMSNFIIAGTDRNDLKSGIIVTTDPKAPDFNTIEAIAKNLQNATLESALTSLTKLSELQKLSGSVLLSNFSQLSEGSGPLRVLQTLLTNLSNLSGVSGMREFLDIMKNTQVGNTPFSQWGTPGGAVEAWVKTASDSDLTLAAERIQGIVKDVLGLKDKLIAHQNGHHVHIESPKLNLPRFGNIYVNPNTQVHLKDHTPMPANIVSTGGMPVAIACSYPKGTLSAIESHMRMIVEQKPSCLVVLTGDDQIQGKRLPDYFRQPGTIGSVSIEVDRGTSNRTPHGVEYDQYNLKVSSGNETHNLPVIHVQSWADHQALQNANQLLDLAQLTRHTSMMSESIYENTGNIAPGLPMIHCFGGVGRTGTLITAVELLKDPSLSSEQIIADLRETRNTKMAEDKPQQQQLRQLEQLLGTRKEGPSTQF